MDIMYAIQGLNELTPEDMAGKKYTGEKYFIKTRGITLADSVALSSGIKRVYNYTSDINFMHDDDVSRWVAGLVVPGQGEAVIVEKAIKVISGTPLFVSSCIVFNSIESCNVFYMKNLVSYHQTKGFDHLYN